jgi:hypothetical protein
VKPPALLCSLLLAAAAGAAAQGTIHRCATPDGGVTLSDKPCPLTQPRTPTPAVGARPASGALSEQQRRQVAADLERQLAAAMANRQAPAQPPAREPATLPPPVVTPMSYPECTANVRSMVLTLAGQRRTRVIVAGPAFSITRICTDDASLLVTCSAPDGRMVITRSPPNPADCTR